MEGSHSPPHSEMTCSWCVVEFIEHKLEVLQLAHEEGLSKDQAGKCILSQFNKFSVSPQQWWRPFSFTQVRSWYICITVNGQVYKE